MKKILWSLLFIFPAMNVHAWSVAETRAEQMLVVLAESWSSSDAKMTRFQKTAEGFQPVGETIPVVLGKSGLAWGKGLHPEQNNASQKNGR